MAMSLSRHPLRGEGNAAKRVDYLNFLRYYTTRHSEDDRFAKAMLKLYEKVFCSGLSYTYSPKPTIWGLTKYRHALYLDLWKMNAFRDPEKALRILNDLNENAKMFFLFRKKMNVLCDCLYSQIDPIQFDNISWMIEQWRENATFLEREDVFTVLITANMSAGKSTLINALVGKRVNKSQSMACTAKIHYIYNKPYEDGYIAEDDGELELDADDETLMTDNPNNKSDVIIVSTFYKLLTSLEKPCCIIDTPGVNSAMDLEHKHITNNAIGQASFDKLIYVINADGGIATDDEFAYMSELSKKVDVSKAIFVVNKLDRFRSAEDDVSQSLAGILSDIERSGFKGAAVYPISAYTGYLAKKHLYGDTLSEDEQDDYNDSRRLYRKEAFKLARYYPESVRNRCSQIASKAQSEAEEKDLQLLVECGLMPLEVALFDKTVIL